MHQLKVQPKISNQLVIIAYGLQQEGYLYLNKLSTYLDVVAQTQNGDFSLSGQYLTFPLKSCSSQEMENQLQQLAIKLDGIGINTVEFFKQNSIEAEEKVDWKQFVSKVSIKVKLIDKNIAKDIFFTLKNQEGNVVMYHFFTCLDERRSHQLIRFGQSKSIDQSEIQPKNQSEQQQESNEQSNQDSKNSNVVIPQLDMKQISKQEQKQEVIQQKEQEPEEFMEKIENLVTQSGLSPKKYWTQVLKLPANASKMEFAKAINSQGVEIDKDQFTELIKQINPLQPYRCNVQMFQQAIRRLRGEQEFSDVSEEEENKSPSTQISSQARENLKQLEYESYRTNEQNIQPQEEISPLNYEEEISSSRQESEDNQSQKQSSVRAPNKAIQKEPLIKQLSELLLQENIEPKDFWIQRLKIPASVSQKNLQKALKLQKIIASPEEMEEFMLFTNPLQTYKCDLNMFQQAIKRYRGEDIQDQKSVREEKFENSSQSSNEEDNNLEDQQDQSNRQHTQAEESFELLKPDEEEYTNRSQIQKYQEESHEISRSPILSGQGRNIQQIENLKVASKDQLEENQNQEEMKESDKKSSQSEQQVGDKQILESQENRNPQETIKNEDLPPQTVSELQAFNSISHLQFQNILEKQNSKQDKIGQSNSSRSESIEDPQPYNENKNSGNNNDQKESQQCEITYDQVQDIFQHIEYTMQINRLNKNSFGTSIFNSMNYDEENQLSENQLSNLLKVNVLKLTNPQKNKMITQFLMNGSKVAKIKSIIQRGLQFINNWEVVKQEEESQLDNNIRKLVIQNFQDLTQKLQKVDKEQSGIVSKKDFYNVVQSLNINFSEQQKNFMDLLFFSSTDDVQNVPYRDFLSAYGIETDSNLEESPEESNMLQSQEEIAQVQEIQGQDQKSSKEESKQDSEEEEDSEEIEISEEERIQIFHSCLSKIWQNIKNKNLTLDQVFPEQMNPNQFLQGLEKIGLGDFTELEFTILFRSLAPELDDDVISINNIIEKLQMLEVDKKDTNIQLSQTSAFASLRQTSKELIPRPITQPLQQSEKQKKESSNESKSKSESSEEVQESLEYTSGSNQNSKEDEEEEDFESESSSSDNQLCIK